MSIEWVVRQGLTVMVCWGVRTLPSCCPYSQNSQNQSLKEIEKEVMQMKKALIQDKLNLLIPVWGSLHTIWCIPVTLGPGQCFLQHLSDVPLLAFLLTVDNILFHVHLSTSFPLLDIYCFPFPYQMCLAKGGGKLSALQSTVPINGCDPMFVNTSGSIQ